MAFSSTESVTKYLQINFLPYREFLLAREMGWQEPQEIQQMNARFCIWAGLMDSGAASPGGQVYTEKDNDIPRCTSQIAAGRWGRDYAPFCAW